MLVLDWGWIQPGTAHAQRLGGPPGANEENLAFEKVVHRRQVFTRRGAFGLWIRCCERHWKLGKKLL